MISTQIVTSCRWRSAWELALRVVSRRLQTSAARPAAFEEAANDRASKKPSLPPSVISPGSAAAKADDAGASDSSDEAQPAAE